MAGIVHRFKRHARAHRAIANHRQSHHRGRCRKPRPNRALQRNPSAALMEVELWAAPKGSNGDSERLVKPLSPSFCRKRANPIAPPGQDFMRVTLVADIPDDLVTRRVKDRMKGHRQLNNSQARPQMPAGFRHGRYRFGPQLVRQLRQLRIRQAFQIGRTGYSDPRKRCFGAVCHLDVRTP